MDRLLSDPWIAAQIDAAVAPYVGSVSPDEIAWMRERLAEVLATDPGAAELLAAARPRVVDESGEVPREALADLEAEPTGAPGRRGRGAAGSGGKASTS